MRIVLEPVSALARSTYCSLPAHNSASTKPLLSRDTRPEAAERADLEPCLVGLAGPEVHEALPQRRVVEQVGAVETQLDRGDR